MRSLVVYESIYGNTRRVAMAIGEALGAQGEVETVEVSGAPSDLSGFDLIVVGGPIHAWSMSSAMTRSGARDEARRAGVEPVSAGRGLREWLAGLRPSGGRLRAAAFDTAVHVPRLVPQGSAARPAADRLSALGARLVAPPEHFFVLDKDGPLADGELDRARAWARGLAAGEAHDPTPAGSALPRRGLTVGLTLFAACTAMMGGAELIAWPAGNAFVPLSLLQGTAFGSFLIPGLLLGGVVGGACAAAAILAWRRSARAPDALLLAGGALSVWIVAEVAQLRTFHWLHGLYGALGFTILGLGMAAAWASGGRLRWIVAVTLGEGVGFLFPVGVGVLTAQAGLAQLPQSALVVAAGVIEGLCLGLGQALAMPVPVNRARYAALSGLGAGLAWAAGLAVQGLGAAGAPLPVLLGVGVAAGAFALAALGGAQWLALRGRVAARRWVGWTALAWILALPLSFLPAPLVDGSTPAGTSLALWACSGLMMAHVMAQVTWGAARGLATPASREGRAPPFASPVAAR